MPKNIIRYVRELSVNKLAALCAVLLVVLAGALSLALFFVHSGSAAGRLPVNVYYINDSGGLQPERHYIKQGGNDEMVQSVLELFMAPPADSTLYSPLNSDIHMVSGQIVNDTVLEIGFSTDYKNMPPLDEALFRAALVWTMTELDFVKGVHFYVGNDELLSSGGQPLGIMGRSNILINPVIAPDKVNSQFVKLYFADNASMLLVSEMRLVNIDSNDSVEKSIVSELIAGTRQKSLNSLVPPQTRLIGADTADGICTVNLSSDFITGQTGGEEKVRLTVYSIVDSLTELPEVRQVQFLIDGQKTAGFDNGVNLSGPIDRNPLIILK